MFFIQQLFWSNVNFTDNFNDCWNWICKKDKDGYGYFYYNYKTYRATRFVYQLYHPEKILTRTDFICHKCDNPSCVNPLHLFLGNVQINTADMVNKNRQAKGEKCWKCKLKKSDIEKMVSNIINGKYKSYSQISRELGISVTHVIRILDMKFRREEMTDICNLYCTTPIELKKMCKYTPKKLNGLA